MRASRSKSGQGGPTQHPRRATGPYAEIPTVRALRLDPILAIPGQSPAGLTFQSELPEIVKHWDRDAVRAFSDVLDQAGLDIYRLSPENGQR